MIYELKRYVAADGKFDDLVNRFADRTLPVFERVGIKVVNCWTCPDEPGVFYYMTHFDTEQRRVSAWKAFAEDTEWRETKAASEVNGPLLASQTSTLLVQAPFMAGQG